MYRKILLGLDGRRHTRKAVGAAIALCTTHGARLVGLHVRNEWILLSKMVSHELYAVGRQEYRDYVHQKLGEKAQKVIAHFEEEARKAGVDYEVKLRGGKPAEEFLKEANTGEYDLAIVGSKPLKTKLERWHSYRFPEEVLKKIEISLLVVK